VTGKLSVRTHRVKLSNAFPGMVAMVPGSFAFRAVVGSLEIAAASAAPALVAETAFRACR
jgi:uncharacterized membrane protein YjjB (DUF3815 family)